MLYGFFIRVRQSAVSIIIYIFSNLIRILKSIRIWVTLFFLFGACGPVIIFLREA